MGSDVILSVPPPMFVQDMHRKHQKSKTVVDSDSVVVLRSARQREAGTKKKQKANRLVFPPSHSDSLALGQYAGLRESFQLVREFLWPSSSSPRISVFSTHTARHGARGL